MTSARFLKRPDRSTKHSITKQVRQIPCESFSPRDDLQGEVETTQRSIDLAFPDLRNA
jgi:hypothetical protein